MKSSDKNGQPEDLGKASTPSRDNLDLQRRSTSEKLFHQLARVFNGLHWGIGITTLPENATAREEQSFVLMWLGIIVFIVLVFAIMLYLL